MPTRAIRSSAHRQILAWLRHGPSTVSEIANQFDMRMPHASLACRQLRSQKLIVRDESGGLRNAPMYLSQQGIERLREDTVSKLRQYNGNFEGKNSACVLHADPSNVLIGYVEPPPSPLLFVPSTSFSTDETSTGNKGGVWVLTSEESVEWFSLRDFQPTPPPSTPQGTTLQDFGQPPDRVGVVRGTVFESTLEQGLVEGSVFPLNMHQSVTPPFRLKEGEIPLGTVIGTTLAYHPPHGLQAHLPSALDRALVLSALGQDAVQVSDRWGVRKRRLPLSVLRAWLEAKHTRMAKVRLASMLADLIQQLRDPVQPLPPSIRRELSVDFGEVEWTSEDWEVGEIDIYGMAQRGVEAVLSSLVEANIPCCIDWPFEPSSTPLRERLLSHSSCRVWITRKGTVESDWFSSNMLSSSAGLATVGLTVGRGSTLPLTLGVADTQPRASISPISVPADAAELIQHNQQSSSSVYSLPPPSGEAGRRLASALNVYPEGDEVLANRYEIEDALSAWIASPPEQRPQRWVRIHGRLPLGWVDLMEVGDAPLSHLPQAISIASERWQHRAFHRIRTEIYRSPTFLLELVAGLEDEEHARWYATCLLNSLDTSQAEHLPLIKQASEIWMRQPAAEIEVVEHLFGRCSLQAGFADLLLEEWLAYAQQQPKTSVLSSWAEAVDIVRTGGPCLPDKQRQFMQSLPESWWSPFASEWLASQLSSASGRSWLKSHQIAWLSLLFVQEGMLQGLPGALVPFPVFTLSADQIITINLLGDGPGVSMLSDVYETVYAHEQGLPVPSLSSHPLGGWLIRPPSTWPAFGATVLDMGDPTIGRLLYARSFAQRM